MSNGTFTPGPWRYDASDGSIVAGHQEVCTFCTDDAGWMVNADNNARLIAAAPAMRELINRLRSVAADPYDEELILVDGNTLTELPDLAERLIDQIDGKAGG